MQRWLFSSRLFELKHSEEHVPQLPPQEVASSGGGRPGALQDSLVHQTQAVINKWFELRDMEQTISLHFVLNVQYDGRLQWPCTPMISSNVPKDSTVLILRCFLLCFHPVPSRQVHPPEATFKSCTSGAM